MILIIQVFKEGNVFYPVRNLTPLLPPGQAPPRKGSCTGGRPYGPEAKEGKFIPFVKPAGPALGRDRGR